MTADFDPVPEPDDRPATLSPPPAPAPALAAARVPRRPRVSRWGKAFRWWLGLSALSFVGIALCVFIGVDRLDLVPMHIVVDGNDLSDGITINGLSDGGRVLLAIAAGFVALLLVLLVPLLILLVVGSLAVALVLGIGAPLVVLAVALAVGTSPFWLVGLLVWLMLRRRDSHRLAASATMPA